MTMTGTTMKKCRFMSCSQYTKYRFEWIKRTISLLHSGLDWKLLLAEMTRLWCRWVNNRVKSSPYPSTSGSWEHCYPETIWCIPLQTVLSRGYRAMHRSMRELYFESEGIITVGGHPRSFISLPVKSAYATSYYLSVATLDLSFFPHFMDIAVFLLKTATAPPFHAKIGDVSVGLDCRSRGSKELRLVIRSITCMIKVSQRYRQTDGRTTLT